MAWAAMAVAWAEVGWVVCLVEATAAAAMVVEEATGEVAAPLVQVKGAPRAAEETEAVGMVVATGTE